MSFVTEVPVGARRQRPLNNADRAVASARAAATLDRIRRNRDRRLYAFGRMTRNDLAREMCQAPKGR